MKTTKTPPTDILCDCGSSNAKWHGDRYGRRTFCCENCYERNVLNVCADALKKLWAVHRDIAKSNPGFLGRLALQDYAQYNEAMGDVPEALNALAAIRNDTTETLAAATLAEEHGA